MKNTVGKQGCFGLWVVFFFKPSNHNQVQWAEACASEEVSSAREPRRSLSASVLRREGTVPTVEISPVPGPVSMSQTSLRTHTGLARSLTMDRRGKIQMSSNRLFSCWNPNDFSLTPKLSLLLFQAKLAFWSPQKLTLFLGLLPQTYLKHAAHAKRYLLFSHLFSGWPPTSFPKTSRPFLKLHSLLRTH